MGDKVEVSISDVMGLAHEMREWAKANGFPQFERAADELKDAVSKVLDLRESSTVVQTAAFPAYPLK